MLISDVVDLAAAIQWCDICRAHKEGHCDGCGLAFLPGENWYRSQTYHFHPAAIEGIAATRSVNKQLCVECYRKDHAKAYPNAAVPDLPDRGVDPKFHASQRTQRQRERLATIQEHLRANNLPPSFERGTDLPSRANSFAPEDFELLGRVIEVGLRFM